MRKGDICFSRGLKIGALCILLTALTMGCDVGDPGTKQEQTQGSQYELPFYKFKRYDFLPDLPDGRERVRLNPAIPDQENVFQIMENLEQFIKTEVSNVNRELNCDINNNPQNDLQQSLYKNFPYRGSLDTLNKFVYDNYAGSAKYFAQIINTIGDSHNQAKFRACYDMLADRAYRDSLHLQDFNLPFQEVPADENLPGMQAALTAVGIDANNYQQIEDEFDTLLSQVAVQNGLRPETLRGVTNFALLNESIYGVNNYIYKGFNGNLIPAKPEKVNDRYTFAYRLGTEFNVRINKELQNLQVNNLARDNELTR